jgi:hypothetical protein
MDILQSPKTTEQLIESSSVRRNCVSDLRLLHEFGIQSAFSKAAALNSGAILIQEILMKNLLKVAVATVALMLGSALPALAQIADGMGFKTSFPFYAGNAKMPAGSYRITPMDMDSSELRIQSADGKYSAFVDFTPMHAEQPHAHSDVTFHKYGDVEYLNRIWVAGQRYGMRVEPTKAEVKAASTTAVAEHTVTGL